MGLRLLDDLQLASTCKRLWTVIYSQHLIRADWARKKYLEQKYFWTLPESPYDSASWKVILCIRPIAQPLITYGIGDELKTSF